MYRRISKIKGSQSVTITSLANKEQSIPQIPVLLVNQAKWNIKPVPLPSSQTTFPTIKSKTLFSSVKYFANSSAAGQLLC